MKYSFKIKTLGVALALVSVFSSCTNDFDEINTDPNSLTEDQLDATMAGPSFASALYAGIHNGSYSSPGVDDQGTWGIATGILSSTFIQYLNCGYGTERNAFVNGYESRGWTRFYTVAVPALNNAIKASEGNAEALAILKIWKVFMYNQMVDAYGPIPYTEAGNKKEKVPYDSVEFIYEDFFKLLDEANATLSGSSMVTVASFQPNDRLYAGNVANWRVFGNSLRLRLALRISDIQPAKAKSQAEAAVAAGVMQTNGQGAFFKASNITPNNLNMIVNSWGYTMTASMESILVGYNDPRLAKWFSKIDSGVYRGQPIGGLEDQFGTTKFSAFNNDIMGNGAAGNLSETKNIEVFMASENYFSRAEGALNGWNMGGTAQDLYEAGIRASLAQWGITDAAAINAYIAGNTLPTLPNVLTIYPTLDLLDIPVKLPVAWSAAAASQRTQIAVQKYLAIFPESWESWADLRRSDAKIIYAPLNTDNNDAGVGKSLMKRIIYTTNEYSSNKDAVTDGIVKLNGPDTGGTKLWWDTK
ncbi:SusD/RagB family nutrient-binding outer membrane lipoprotein [Flavobacterium psychroterrae]|uniref:SusD/RagB family nutrient-binding outer membrane lipoprotein n=1 Tax=Flavobacterium psychroterrae TaxID=2133767 RepID=A0ABS5PAG5_9FLAO|nr:SusD/RagB family nutrient-binding outer membrane lipoprotein [Flavobacterium psychroterrae]MBS7231315.1 SusD/RagB family nutrient-binding outer membrane lipoprotein [Flavobacterium psychroterrae]